MSETISNQTTAAATPGQTAAGKQTRTPSNPGSKPGTPGANAKGDQTGTPRPGQSADAQGKPRNPLENSGESTESDRPASGLPDELDFDALSDEDLKKLSKWKKKIKVDGKEVSVPMLQAMQYLQKELAADKRMWEGTRATKEKEQIIQMLRDNPTAVLEKFGHNVDELAKARVLQAIQQAEMSPEQREAVAARAEAEKWKNKAIADEKARVEQARLHYMAKTSEGFQKDIVGALQKSGLPPDPLTLKLTAQIMLANRSAGYKDFTAADAVPMVRDFCLQMARYYMKSLPMPELFKALGDDWDGNVRKFLLEESANPIKEGFKQTPAGNNKNAGATPKSEKYLNADQYRERMDKKWG